MIEYAFSYDLFIDLSKLYCLEHVTVFVLVKLNAHFVLCVIVLALVVFQPNSIKQLLTVAVDLEVYIVRAASFSLPYIVLCHGCVRPCDCEVDSNFVSYISIIASYRETVLICVESQIRKMSITSRMRLIVNECEMFESQHTLIGLDLTRLIN